MKIQLKRSNVLDGGKAKQPTAEQMEYGELAVNYNTADPSIFLKDSDNNIVNIIDTTTPPGDGTITIKQPGTSDQTFTVNQTGNTEITLKNDDTIVTPGNGALTIESYGSNDSSTGTFTANQTAASTITLPQISYTDLSNIPALRTIGDGTITIKQPGTSDQTFTVNQTGNTEINLKNDNTVVTPGNGRITIKQPGTSDQSFTVDQTGNTEINLKNDNTQVTPGNGALTIKTAGEGASAGGTFTANQSSGSTLTLPTIRYGDLSGKPSIPAAANNGTITIKQPGTSDQSFTVNQSGNTTINLKNDNTVPSVGNGTITVTQPGTSNQTFTVNQSGNTTIALKNDNTNTTYTASSGVQLSGTNFTADSSVVRTSGNQTIGGTKTFSVTTVCDQTLVSKNYREAVYTIGWSSGFALKPLNGETQFVVLGGNSTPTQNSWNNGESITLHIDDGSGRTINWGTLGVVWTGGDAPELATTGDTVVQLWKANNIIYGAIVGEVA